MDSNFGDAVYGPVPSLGELAGLTVDVGTDAGSATALGVPVATDGPVPAQLGVTREQLQAAGFDGAVGTALAVPGGDGAVMIAVGVGAPDSLTPLALRDAGGALGRAAKRHAHIAVVAPSGPVDRATTAQCLVEGIVLSRYTYDSLRNGSLGDAVQAVTVVAADGADTDALQAGAAAGATGARATSMARDLSNTPHSHLSAAKIADLAVALGPVKGFTVEVFDKAQLQEMGCGGLLGVNAGSVEPPRMVKMTYRPEGTPTGHLGLVGKGIMYDSGGLSLKPGDEVHAQMKNDMSGASAVLAAMSVLRESNCPTAVTAWLMCTDNMPSGTAMALGDVITMRGGKTVEVINTDAEGRLVMADALVLATEDGVDAVVDIATLTGACMRALGTLVAGVMGNDQPLIELIRAAADTTDESVWQLPLERRYRAELDSPVADMRNLGGANGGAITAALFLEEFVGDTPWAHIDIAGTAQTPADRLWHTNGCSGFGARLLVELVANFRSTRA